MWIFAKEGFVSIVADRDDPKLLMVRARFGGDIQAVFPGTKVKITPDADYRFRARIDRVAVGTRLVELTTAINYDNFKNATPDGRHGVLLRIWSIMMGEQDRVYPPKRREFDYPTLRAPKPKGGRRGRKAQRSRLKGLFADDLTPWAGLPLVPYTAADEDVR
jgi:hypothetical protein